jgi:hypothetical protein
MYQVRNTKVPSCVSDLFEALLSCRTAKLAAVAAIVAIAGAMCALPAAAQTATGTLMVSAAVQGSIQLVFENNANVGQVGYCPLANAGTNNARLDLGVAVFTSGDSLACVDFKKNVPSGGYYDVSSAFDVVVNKANTASASYRLAVAISSVPPANVSWSMNALAMTTAAQTLQAANAYGRTTETLHVSVRNSVPAQVLNEVITFTATAN